MAPRDQKYELDFQDDVEDRENDSDDYLEEDFLEHVQNVVNEKNKLAFDKVLDKIRNGDVGEWFESVALIINRKEKEYDVHYLEPLLTTPDLGRKLLLLLHAIEKAIEKSGHAQSVNAIAARKLALRLLKNEPALAWQRAQDQETALHRAAAAYDGAGNILDGLIKTLEREQRLSQALNNQYQLRTPLETAVFWGNAAAVTKLIAKDTELRTRAQVLSLAIERNYQDIFGNVLSKCPELLRLDQMVLAKIVEKNATKAWDRVMETEEIRTGPSLMASCNILHKAVEFQRDSFVRDIVALQPELAVQFDNNTHSTLWYNKPNADDDDRVQNSKEAIRRTLVPAIVRELDTAETRRMFRDAKHKLGQISLNLDVFDHPDHNFASFLDAIAKDQTSKLKPMCADIPFEHILRYLGFPDFDTMEDDPVQTGYVTRSILRERNPRRLRWEDEPTQEIPASRTIRRDYVVKVLNWLKDSKEVTDIVHLSVPDSLEYPHPEYVIENAIRPFHIEVLDWRRVDLSIDSIRDSAPGVRELYLYSSGNKATLRHWLGDEGIQTLTKLKKLVLVIYKHNLNDGLALRLEHEAKTTLERLKNVREEFTFKVSLADWDAKRASVHKGSWGESNDLAPLELDALRPFLKYFYEPFQKAREKTWHRVKVAVIDNGIDDYSFERNIEGISFVYRNGKEHNWFIATHSHGTRMAKFIRQFDPFCELRVAKVGDSTDDISPDRVIQAIRWAIDEKVDIISMSVALPKPSKELRALVTEAAGKDILFFCSTADTIKERSNVWPADYDEIFGIATQQRAESATKGTSDGDANYTFHGHTHGVDEICYIENSTQNVAGSSVATANAAGMASLILSCGKYVNENYIVSRKGLVKDVFKKMKVEDRNPKLIRPGRFFPQEKIDIVKGEKFIRKYFKQE